MPRANHRLIIDTNLWISILLSSKYEKIDAILYSNTTTLLFSKELFDEFIEVAQRPKFKKYFSNEDLIFLAESIQANAEFVDVRSVVKECRDVKDDFLLSLALDGGATHLVTGDKDLLDLKKFGATRIVTFADYLAEKT
jgi:uncharacterized protein